MIPNILYRTLKNFHAGGELPNGELTHFFDALLNEQDEQLLADILTAWKIKGMTEDEMFGLASLMRARCIRIESPHEIFVDAVGTGGSPVKTFNVSTAAAFVIAGAGIRVAKHGNRAASSRSGSADVLDELGVEASVDPQIALRCLNEIGICFMFAPNFHRLSPVLGKVRRGLGFPTIFNILGPLCNPAGAPHQLIGVWDSGLLEKTARVLARLGTKRSWIVNGSDGLDEITLDGPTHVAEVANDGVRLTTIEPEAFGVAHSKVDQLRISTPQQSARLILRVLKGEEKDQPAEHLVLLNAAAAIRITSAASLKEAFHSAEQSIRNGSAARKLGQLAKMTRE